MKVIADDTFCNVGLTSIDIPSSVTSIGNAALVTGTIKVSDTQTIEIVAE